MPLAVLSAGPARAEGEMPLDRQPDPLSTRWKLGPVRLDPFVRIEDLGWDSNVFLADRGSERSDLRTRLAAGVRGQVLFGSRGSLSFEEKPDYVAYARTAGENYFSNRLTGRGDLVSGRLSLGAGGSWITSRDSASSEFDERARTTTRSAFAAIAWRTVSRTSVSLTGSRGWLTISDRDVPSLGSLLDRKESRLAERVSWRALPRTTLYTEHSTLRTNFTDTPERDSRLESWSVGARMEGRGPLTGMLQIGPSRLTSDDPRWTGDRTLSGEANAAVRAGDSWLILAGGQRALQFAIFETNLYYRETRFYLNARRALGPRLAVEGGAEWFDLRWPGRDRSLVPTSGGDVPACSLSSLACGELRRDRILSRFVGIRFKLARRTEMSARLTVRRRESNIPSARDDQIVFTTGAGF